MAAHGGIRCTCKHVLFTEKTVKRLVTTESRGTGMLNSQFWLLEICNVVGTTPGNLVRSSGDHGLISGDRMISWKETREMKILEIYSCASDTQGTNSTKICRSLKNILEPSVCLVGLRVDAAQGLNRAC